MIWHWCEGHLVYLRVDDNNNRHSRHCSSYYWHQKIYMHDFWTVFLPNNLIHLWKIFLLSTELVCLECNLKKCTLMFDSI